MKIIKDFLKIDEHNNKMLFNHLRLDYICGSNIKNKLHYKIQNAACLKEKLKIFPNFYKKHYFNKKISEKVIL